ncbi:hypothetical protein TNCV_4616231 [Trichonephila clavipes]|nr:hypothetical protein TNCV_4616231 [Trichonephila clavipes]
MLRKATVQQPLTTVSPNSNPTIVILQAEAGFVSSKHNVVPFSCPCPPFIASLAGKTLVVSSQGLNLLSYGSRCLRDPLLPCAKSTCHYWQCCNEVGVVGPSSPPASRLLFFLDRIQRLGQKTLDVFHET